MLGQTLGYYEILGQLGAGGMGVVYRALDTTLDREVALKILPPDFASDAERAARFEREAKALASLNHPNIVTIHSIESARTTTGPEGDQVVHFLTMELVDGEPLSTLIPSGGMRLGGIFDIAVPLADALAAAHKQGIVHRDLKPSNIMVTTEGRVKVLDFGLAKLRQATDSEAATELPTEPLTQEGLVVGTVPYMSPEQLEGKELDARSDTFSLGVVLFEMATGRRPFRGDSPAAVISAIMRETPGDVDALRDDLPHHLGRIVRHCLDKDPDQRFQTARDLCNELIDLRRECESGQQATVTTAPADRPRAPRGPWIVVGMVVAAIAVIAVWLVSQRAPPGEAETRGEIGPPRIVVLPFENLGSPDDEYFADGITEEITSRLASVSGLSVISRTSAMQYKESRPSVTQIGDELGVQYALEGTVRWARDGDGPSRVRVTPQLIRVADDSHLWSENYDRVLDDIFAIQTELAQQVLARMDVELADSERSSVEVRPTEDLDAYQAFLRGKHLLHQPHFNLESWNQALRSLELAVEIDPTFSQAWMELAKAHSRLIYFKVDTSEERRALAHDAVRQAAASDADAPEVHLTQGFYHLWATRDAEAARSEFEIAARQMPNSTELLEGQGELARLQGRMEDAIGFYSRAAELSPLDASPEVELGITLWAMRLYPKALQACDRAIALAPDEPWPYLTKVWTLWSWKGHVPEARAALEGANPEHPWTPWFWFWLEVYEADYDAALGWLDRNPGEWVRLKMWIRPEALLRAYVHDLRDESDSARTAYEEAARLLEAAVEANPDEARLHGSLGIAYAALGRNEEAVREGRRATELFPLSEDAAYALPHAYDLVHIHSLVGDLETALSETDRLLAIPGWFSIPWLETDPRWAPLRDSTRFQSLREKYPIE